MAEKRTATAIAPGVTLIKGIDFECCIWLVEGNESALLIETGLGDGDLRAEVEALTKLPYKVVNTHGHGDHSGGNYHFEEVYLHAEAVEAAETAIEMTKMFVGPEEIAAIEERMRTKPCKLNFISEGFTFDLGGRKLSVIEVPGHTPGDIALYDDEAGLLFSGDCLLKAMNVLLVVPQTKSVAQYVQSMKKLREKVSGNFVGFCSGHDQCIMPASFLDDAIVCAEGIVDGTLPGKQIESGLPGDAAICMQAGYGQCEILFDKDRIR